MAKKRDVMNAAEMIVEEFVPCSQQASARPLMSLTADEEQRAEANLLGKGFLRRGQGALFVGPTGIGKSSLLIQASILWSLGESCFGIRPEGPLTILMIQAENDDIDLVEMRDGVLAGLKLSVGQRQDVELRVHVMTEHATSAKLLEHIEPEVERLDVDLLILDPVFAYVGGSVSDQEVVTTFLRALLQPFLVKHDIGAFIVHHSNKPPIGKEKSMWRAGDFAYAGSGSIEFANWARGVIYLRSIGSGQVFELRAGKRGKRLGLCDDHGNTTEMLLVRHARTGIFWEMAGAQDVPDADPYTEAVFTAFRGMKLDPAGGVSVEALAAKLRQSKRTLNRRFQGTDSLTLNGETLIRRAGSVFLQVDAA